MYKVIKFRKRIILSFAISSFAILASVLVTAKATQLQQVEVPIIMYHSILQDEAYQGDYVISPTDFEEDLIYLTENGYTAIGIQDLLDYVNGVADLPEKPIILSFDDGYYNNYLYAYPLALEYEMKIVISPIAYMTEIYSEEETLSAYYSHITTEQIREMFNSGYVEFGNHSYNLHSSSGTRLGIEQVAGESLENYTAVISEDIMTAQELLIQVTGFNTKLFVYPFGAISSATPSIISDLGFSVTFTCEERINIITKEWSSLENLGRYIRPSNKSVEEILE